MRRTQLLCMAMALLAVPSFALADSISPDFDQATLTLNQTYNRTKTVTVDGFDADKPIDVVFVFDSTSTWNDFFSGANGWTSGNTIPERLIAEAGGRGSDVAFGVVTYQDFPVQPWGADGSPGYVPPDVGYNMISDLQTNTTTAVNALKAITANNGNDEAEANLHALGTLAQTMGWRANSTRVVLWFGDNPGHPWDEDDGLGNLYGDASGGFFDTASAIAALQASGVLVEALDFDNLDGPVFDFRGNPAGKIDEFQATTITSQTYGDYWTGFWDATDLSLTRFEDMMTTVGLALDAALYQYIVELDTSGVPGILGLTGAGGSFTGNRFTGPENFVWNLQYTPTNPAAVGQTYGFGINALVDGLFAAGEDDLYDVIRGNGTPGGQIPEPSTVALLGLGLLGVGIVARRRRK